MKSPVTEPVIRNRSHPPIVPGVTVRLKLQKASQTAHCLWHPKKYVPLKERHEPMDRS
jgi:hypothetical protein